MTAQAPESKGPSGPAGRAKRIVVGVDGSAVSGGALEWAAQQAERTGSTLEIVMAWNWPGTYGWNLPLSDDYDPAADARKAVGELGADTKRAHPELPIVTRVELGYPAPLLVEASQGADLLVVGNRGHREFVGMLLGSVSQYCATKAHCPVMIYRETD
jgi:nucleotide-binding universal stress UspA family protein